MVFKHFAIVTILICGCGSSFSQSDWINISTSKDDTTWDIKPGSFEFSKTKAGVPIALVVGRTKNPDTSQISLYKWYVTINDCKKQMGSIVSLNIDGTYFHENEFVFGSGNIASSLAETICSVAEYSEKRASEKSL